MVLPQRLSRSLIDHAHIENIPSDLLNTQVGQGVPGKNDCWDAATPEGEIIGTGLVTPAFLD